MDESMSEDYKLIPIESVSIHKNIRREYNERELNKLAESLKNIGQLEPIGVYEIQPDKYEILFGHRRFKAAQQANIPELKCIIKEKPKNDVERIYIQATENELCKSLLPRDREDYIIALLDAGQNSSEICKKLGKTQAWVTVSVKAKKARDQFEAKFLAAGIELDTYSAYRIAGASEEAVDKAVQDIIKNPKQRKTILKELADSKPKTTTKGRKRKTNDGTESPSGVQFLNQIIQIDELKKEIVIRPLKSSAEPNDGLLKELEQELRKIVTSFFVKNGYSIAQ
jgi:ParB/RepB/Spo0J family partition protein